MATSDNEADNMPSPNLSTNDVEPDFSNGTESLKEQDIALLFATLRNDSATEASVVRAYRT